MLLTSSFSLVIGMIRFGRVRDFTGCEPDGQNSSRPVITYAQVIDWKEYLAWFFC